MCSGRSFYINSVGRKISGVANSWIEMGHRVHHICGGDIENNIGSDLKPILKLNQIIPNSWRSKIIKKIALISNSISEWRDIQHDKKIFKFLMVNSIEYKPNLIWERSCRLHCSGLKIARLLGIPYVLEWKDHLVDYKYSFFRNRALAMEEYKNKNADFIVVESEVLRNKLSNEGVDFKKIIVSHNAVDSNEFIREPALRKLTRDSFGLEDNVVLVGYLGSYAFYHDTRRLILAADIINKSNTNLNIRIIMIGEGKEFKESQELAKKLKLIDNILIFKPLVPKEFVPGILSALDIAVLPGSTDIICPIKVQEYMASGLPSIVPDYICNREIIKDGETGILFCPYDEISLANKILFLSENPIIRNGIGINARESAKQFFNWNATWGSALKRITDLQNSKAVIEAI